MRTELLLLLALAVASIFCCRAAGAAGIADAASAAAAALAAPGGDGAGGEHQVVPMHFFPLMEPWQRCLYVCDRCLGNRGKDAELMHCVNSWCLNDVMTTGVVPKAARRACPLMELVE